MTNMTITEQAARTNGLSHDSGFTKCHCSLGPESGGAEHGAGDWAAYGSLSRRRARFRTRNS